MKRLSFWLLILSAALAACATSPATVERPTETPVAARPTRTPPPTATTIPTPSAAPEAGEGFAASPLTQVRERFFSGSGVCAVCHTRLTDESGADVSNDRMWRGTMMANAARDPYWQASVRSEILENPDLRQTIEDKCATCHMPMARYTVAAGGEKGSIFGDGFLNPDNPLHELAMDGVSCTLCHQIQAEGLGLSGSYSGGFSIDTEKPAGERVIYGPYKVGMMMVQTMQASSGFAPEQGLHIIKSELCASCHTLYTPYVDAQGQVVGEFPEQVPYLEWYYSDYRRAQSCQDCHMPEAQGPVVISITGGPPRSPFAQHSFVGGNAFMLQLFETFGAEMGTTASAQQFAAARQRTLQQLQEHTATVSLDEVRLVGSTLIADVSVESQVGHKFPSGYPARRAWLHFVVRDAAGEVVFESGAVNPDGSIVGNDNDEAADAYEPHYFAVVRPDQVQIYETILTNTDAAVTTTLLRAARYVKDNRLLPAGFEKGAPYEDIAVRGRALEDEDFLGGGDRIQYQADVGEAQGPFTVTVELLYQSIGYRWVENLRARQAPEIERFLGYYAAVPNTGTLIASDEAEVGK